jgi:hypothetical protein
MYPRSRRRADARETPPPDAKALEDMARRAWRERGIVILWPERIRDDWDRQHLLNLANSFYGPRHGAAGGK